MLANPPYPALLLSTTEVYTIYHLKATDVPSCPADALLNDEEAMKMLRTKLLSEMAAARGQTTVRVPADPAPRSRVFDSDEYDLEALDATETQSDSIDEIAQEAAHKLALESSDIAEHIIADHQHDSMIQNTAKQQRNKQKQQDNRQQQPADFKQSRSRSSSTSSTDSTSSKQGQQQKSSNDGSSSSRGGGTGPPQLAGDTAIGRVAASKSGVPIVVLKKGKARLFEAGSPMVIPCTCGFCYCHRSSYSTSALQLGCAVLVLRCRLSACSLWYQAHIRPRRPAHIIHSEVVKP